jgi:hypothetical protein
VPNLRPHVFGDVQLAVVDSDTLLIIARKDPFLDERAVGVHRRDAIAAIIGAIQRVVERVVVESR